MYKDLSLSTVNIIKKEQILSCIDIASKYTFIKRMIIFGSSVTDNCTENSDIDICIDMDGSTIGLRTFYMDAELSKACNHNCDILIYNKIGGKIKDEIDNKGVIVYELS